MVDNNLPYKRKNKNLDNQALSNQIGNLTKKILVSITDYDNLVTNKGLSNEDWYPAILAALNAVSVNGTVMFPDGNFVSSQTIIAGTVRLFGNKNTVITTPAGITALNVNDHYFDIENITLNCQIRDHTNAASVGIFFGKKDSNGKYVYLHTGKLKNVKVKQYTTSIALESVYWIQLHEVETYYDKFGLTVNKDTEVINGSGANPVTTLLLNRCYFRGTGNTFPKTAGSKALDLTNVVNLVINTCVTEWYERSGSLATTQVGSIRDLYMEYVDYGMYVNNITGTVIAENTYFNLVGNYVFKIEYGTLITRGGRGVLDANQWFIEKGASSTWISHNDPPVSSIYSGWVASKAYSVGNRVYVNKKVYECTVAGTSGSTAPSHSSGTATDGTVTWNYIGVTTLIKTDANGYLNQNRTHVGTDLEMYDPPNGLTIWNQGYKRTWYKRTGVATEFNDMNINFTVGSNNLGNFTQNGLELNQYLKLGSKSSLPTASSTYRGMIIRIEGGTGVADVTYMCVKNADDSYSWKTLTLV